MRAPPGRPHPARRPGRRRAGASPPRARPASSRPPPPRAPRAGAHAASAWPVMRHTPLQGGSISTKLPLRHAPQSTELSKGNTVNHRIRPALGIVAFTTATWAVHQYPTLPGPVQLPHRFPRSTLCWLRTGVTWGLQICIKIYSNTPVMILSFRFQTPPCKNPQPCPHMQYGSTSLLGPDRHTNEGHRPLPTAP